MPFERPCKNLCTAVTTSCIGLFVPNCTDIRKYDGFNYTDMYDDDNINCNSMSSSSLQIATTHETYL